MRKLLYLVLAAATLAFATPSIAMAQASEDQGRGGPAVSPGHFGLLHRYRVTYFRSSTTSPATRSLTAVSVTNQSAVACNVAVEWFFDTGGGPVCGNVLAIPAGNKRDFCSRAFAPAPAGVPTVCNATCGAGGAPNFGPALTAHEGMAVVDSSPTTACANIAVSARTLYTSTTDAPVGAITDAKVVRFGGGNIGD